MTTFRRSAFLLAGLTLLPFFFTSSAQGANNANSVENAERLAQISQATGASSGNTTTFENRMDAILSTSRTPERTYVASEETSARQRAAVQSQEEAAEEARAQALAPDRYNPKKNKDNFQSANSNAARESKYDGTEKAYQTEKEKIQKEFDERIKKETQANLEKKAAAQYSENQSSSLPSSISNNPFYVGDEKDPDQKKFDSRKAVIVSRLVERGVLDPDEAGSAVGQATSEEDLVVNLMKDYGLTYGDASDVAS